MAGKRGPKIPPKTMAFINQAAVEYSNVDRVRLADVLIEELGERGWITPSLETLKRYISAARNSVTTEDEPWTLGRSIKNGIPTEANSDLLEIWKRCILAGRKLTIREAKWIAYLRGVVDYKELLAKAVKYAIRERVYEMEMEKNPNAIFDTTDIDASIVFADNQWGYEAGIRTGAFEGNGAVRQIIESAKLTDSENANDVIIASSIFMTRPGELQYEMSVGDFDELRDTKELSDEADEVYALWLRKMREAPYWLDRSSEERKQIADQLLDEIIQAFTEYNRESERIQKEAREKYKDSPELSQELDYATARLAFAATKWEPSTMLLKEVGL